jgi:hypothetical protein
MSGDRVPGWLRDPERKKRTMDAVHNSVLDREGVVRLGTGRGKLTEKEKWFNYAWGLDFG